MFRFFKEWYDSHLTDPNQVALALIILFITLVTYILLATVTPILVAIILAYMLEGIVHRFTVNNTINRNTIIDNNTVTANDIRSPESHGTNNVKIISVAVANVGIIILSL